MGVQHTQHVSATRKARMLLTGQLMSDVRVHGRPFACISSNCIRAACSFSLDLIGAPKLLMKVHANPLGANPADGAARSQYEGAWQAVRVHASSRGIYAVTSARGRHEGAQQVKCVSANS